MPNDIFSASSRSSIPGLGVYSGTPATNPTPGTSNIRDILNSAIPGFSKLLGSASGNIDDLLSGDASPSVARRANAYFGASSGMPGSEFVRNRGFDLYGQQGDARKQQGLHDLLSLLSGAAGNLFPTVGEQQSGNQFQQDLGFRQNQAGNQFLQNAMSLSRSRPTNYGGLTPTSHTGLT